MVFSAATVGGWLLALAGVGMSVFLPSVVPQKLHAPLFVLSAVVGIVGVVLIALPYLEGAPTWVTYSSIFLITVGGSILIGAAIVLPLSVGASNQSEGSEKRVPVATLRQWAVDAGWNDDVQAVAVGDNDFWTFKCRLRQAAVDGDIVFWGRKYEYDMPADLLPSKPLVKVPKHHFDDHDLDVMELATSENRDIFTSKTATRRSAQRGEIYRDLYVDRDLARAWLRGNGKPPEPCSMAIALNKSAAKIGDYTPIAALTITNTTNKDLDRCLLSLEQLSGLHPPGMPMPLVLRTDGQVRHNRSGRFTLSPDQPKTIPILFQAYPRHDQWIFKDERGADFALPARSLEMVIGVYGAPRSAKALVTITLLPETGWSPGVSEIKLVPDDFILPKGKTLQ